MHDIVVPDIDDMEMDEDESETSLGPAGINGAAVAALISTLRLRYPDMRGSGAMIVHWSDDGDQIELQIEPWPEEASSRTGDEDPELTSLTFDAAPIVAPDDPAADGTVVEAMETDEGPPPRACRARLVASSRVFRHSRRRSCSPRR